MNTALATTVIGTLVRDPEIRYDRTGVAKTTFSVKAAGGKVGDVETSGELAENVALSLTAGDEVIVFGRLGGDHLDRLIATAVGASLGSATVDVQRYEHR